MELPPTWLIGIVIVGGYCIWKFIIQPIMNENKPIEPPEDYKTIAEQMEDAVQTTVQKDINF